MLRVESDNQDSIEDSGAQRSGARGAVVRAGGLAAFLAKLARLLCTTALLTLSVLSLLRHSGGSAGTSRGAAWWLQLTECDVNVSTVSHTLLRCIERI